MSPQKLNKSLSKKLAGQRGFTLVELMVSLVVASVIIFFVLSIQGRMSGAYRGQSKVSEISRNLRAARLHLVDQLRMAGYGAVVASGQIEVSASVNPAGINGPIRALEVQNDVNGDGNDSFTVIYADSSVESAVQSMATRDSLTVVPGTMGDFAEGDLAIISSRNNACLVEITGVTATAINFAFGGGAPYNDPGGNDHCAQVQSEVTVSPVMIRQAIHRQYRIDPDRELLGVLQMSPSGGLSDDFQDLGVGFSNMQLASRFFEDADVVDSDGDGDPLRDWYSSDNQAEPDPDGVRPITAVLTQVSLSLEAKGPITIEGSGSSPATEAFTEVGNEANNRFGDWGEECPSNAIVDPCGIDLKNTTDGARPERYRGDNVYRASTTLVDLRNMGVGL